MVFCAIQWGFPGGLVERIWLQCRRCKFNPWVRKIPWRRAWQPIPVCLPGESHGQRGLVVYSPQGCKESDMTERLSTALSINEWQLHFPSCSGQQVWAHPFIFLYSNTVKGLVHLQINLESFLILSSATTLV